MKINSFISGCLATITVILGIVFFYHSCQRNNVENSSEKTNETVYDTIPIFIDMPIPKDSVVIRYKTVKVPIYDTIRAHHTDTLFLTAPLSFCRSLKKFIKTPLIKHG